MTIRGKSETHNLHYIYYDTRDHHMRDGCEYMLEYGVITVERLVNWLRHQDSVHLDRRSYISSMYIDYL